MLAILYYWGTKPESGLLLRGKWVGAALLAAGWLLGSTAFGQEDTRPPTIPAQPTFAARAEKVFQAAKARYQSQPTNAEAAWQFGRASYDWAEFATSKDQREEIAQQGIAACRSVIDHDPHSALGHYYLALNLGQFARSRKLGALKLVQQMEGEFNTVLDLDPKLDYAGADRGLGLLYLEAPGWPMSIGSNSKARQHLQKAEKLFPDYPENLLNLSEAYLKTGDRNGALRELRKLNEIWPAARKELTGENWGAAWADWQERREVLLKKTAQKRQ